MIAVATDAFSLSERELALRLGLGGADSSEFGTLPIDEALTVVRRAASCSYCFRESAVSVRADEAISSFAFGTVRSLALSKYLAGAGRVYVFAATLGIGVDRVIRAAQSRGALRQYTTDAVASAMIESLCDHAQAQLPRPTRSRFSPGYGDLSLDVQPTILRFLDAERELGIRLSDSLLMTPTKSVTAIIRIEETL